MRDAIKGSVAHLLRFTRRMSRLGLQPRCYGTQLRLGLPHLMRDAIKGHQEALSSDWACLT